MISGTLEIVRVWIEKVIRVLGYPGITLFMLAEAVFPPIPSELVMPFGGFLAARGELNFAAVVGAGMLGSSLGALVLYFAGREAGERLLRPLLRRYGRWFLLAEADLDRTLGVFMRYGAMAVLFGRLVPLVRSMISLPAGMNRMHLGKFLALTALGTAAWNTVLTSAGWWLGRRWDAVLAFTRQYEVVVFVLVALVLAIFIVRRLGMWPGKRRAPQP